MLSFSILKHLYSYPLVILHAVIGCRADAKQTADQSVDGGVGERTDVLADTDIGAHGTEEGVHVAVSRVEAMHTSIVQVSSVKRKPSSGSTSTSPIFGSDW